MPEHYDEDTEQQDVGTFEEKMRDRVNADYSEAKEFLRPFHQSCITHYNRYFNARNYTNYKKSNKFPYPYAQYMEDRFVSFMVDKLFFKDRPCTIVASDTTDTETSNNTAKEEADVKQEVFNWMDYKDKIRTKVNKALRDCFRYRVAVSQVDYTEIKRKRIVGLKDTGKDDAGADVTTSRVEVVEDIKYMGATVKRIDPTDLFFTEDKSTVDDGEPLMVRTPLSKRQMKKKNYYINLDQLDTMAISGNGDDDNMTIQQKRMTRGLNPTNANRKNKPETIEWHGTVDKYDLYEWMNENHPLFKGKYPLEIEQQTLLTEEEIAGLGKTVEELTPADLIRTEMIPTVERGETTQAICSVTEGKVIVRLEETPFDFHTPNIVIGVMQSDEDEVLGLSLAEKINAVSESLDTTMGVLIENFVQSVNAQHVINTSMILTGAETLVNKAGGVIEVNDNVNAAHKRIEQPQVAPDIFNFIDFMKQTGEDASSIQGILTASGEQGLPTLGANEIALDQATTGLNEYLKSFEETYIEPLYDMRDQVNVQNLDQDYVYGIVGDGAINWKKATPGQIRANVDFICESSTRESNRMIIVQQILQLLQVMPALTAAGIPVRLDLVVKMLMENFNWTQDTIEDILPLLKMEKDGGTDVNMLLFQGLISGLGQNPANQGTGQELPNATSKENVSASLRDNSRTQVS